MNISLVKYGVSRVEISASLLLLSYLAGILCIGFGLFPALLSATPFNLLLTFALLLWSCFDRSLSTVIGVMVVYILGLGLEMIGVSTGLLFGDYVYGSVLGPKIAGTPLLIGVNWFILLVGSMATINTLRPQWAIWKGALSIAALMTCVDFILEPVAIHYGFWNWGAEQVPVQNYMAWFVISFGMAAGMLRYFQMKNTLLAVFSFLCIVVFFVVLNLQIPNVNGLSISMSM